MQETKCICGASSDSAKNHFHSHNNVNKTTDLIECVHWNNERIKNHGGGGEYVHAVNACTWGRRGVSPKGS